LGIDLGPGLPGRVIILISSHFVAKKDEKEKDKQNMKVQMYTKT